MFASCDPKFFAVRHIHYPVPISTLMLVPSSDHCRTDTVLPPSDHCCIETVAPSGDRYCIDIVLPPSDQRCTETLSPSSDHYWTTKVAPPSDPVNTKRTYNRWGDSYERCQWWHHMIPKYERNNFLRAKHDTLHYLMSRWFAKHPPCPPKSFTRLPGNTKKLTFYEPAKLLTEQGTHLSLIKSYQLTFHLYSWLVLPF